MLSCYPWSHPAQSQPSLPNSLPTFSLPYRTSLEILPKLVLSHLVTNPILPIFFPAPVWVTLPTLVLSQLHYIPSSPFFLKAGKSKSWAILSQRVLEPNVFCNHGLADTSEWLLLWPWDPKLDNFRIGEHTFSEGAGGLKPKTVYRSTFNIGKWQTPWSTGENLSAKHSSNCPNISTKHISKTNCLSSSDHHQVAFYLTYILAFDLASLLASYLTYIVPDNLYGLVSGILSDKYSGILSRILSGILSDDFYIELTCFLALAGILHDTDHLANSTWHFIWHILAGVWQSILTVYLAFSLESWLT